MNLQAVEILLRRRSVIALLIITAVLLCVREAFAHGEPIDIRFWGGFPRGAAHCQRVIGAAGSRCALAAVRERVGCLGGALGGGTCDLLRSDAAVQAIRTSVRGLVQNNCSDQESGLLQYRDRFEVLTDVDRMCRELDIAASTLIYGPRFTWTTLAGRDATEKRCRHAAGQAALKLLAHAVRTNQKLLDAIATLRLTIDQKQQLLDRAATRIAAAREALGEMLRASCADEDLARFYPGGADAFLERVVERSRCFAGECYVQSALVCPAPVCGNGVQERDEGCDDGNDNDGDGCRGDCTRVIR